MIKKITLLYLKEEGAQSIKNFKLIQVGMETNTAEMKLINFLSKNNATRVITFANK